MDNMGKLFPALRDKLSHFLPRQGGISSRSLSRKAGLLNFCSCTQDKFVMAVSPGPFAPLRTGPRICPQLKSCTLILRSAQDFWLKYHPEYSGLPGAASGNSHRRILAPRYSDITCRNLTLGPPYCRAVMWHS